MKPFYYLPSAGARERMHHALLPIWRRWVLRQQPPPCDAIDATPGFCTQPFDLADRIGALKVIDASSSHPTSAYGYWKRECDIWCPGAKPGVPQSIFAHMNRELERADLILCPSTFVRDSMLYNGISEDKCAINPYGVNTSIFTPRTTVPDRPVFVCVGGISVRKGYQHCFVPLKKCVRCFPTRN